MCLAVDSPGGSQALELKTAACDTSKKDQIFTFPKTTDGKGRLIEVNGLFALTQDKGEKVVVQESGEGDAMTAFTVRDQGKSDPPAARRLTPTSRRRIRPPPDPALFVLRLVRGLRHLVQVPALGRCPRSGRAAVRPSRVRVPIALPKYGPASRFQRQRRSVTAGRLGQPAHRGPPRGTSSPASAGACGSGTSLWIGEQVS